MFNKAADLRGFFKFKAWLSIDQPDTDIAVQIYEIKADGSSIALASDALRARYRLSTAKETLATKREIWQYDFNSFTFASREVAKGSRLRLLIAALTARRHRETLANRVGFLGVRAFRDSGALRYCYL